DTGDEELAFRAKPHTAAINGEWRLAQRLRGSSTVDHIDIAFARLHRQPDARKSGNCTRGRTRRVDDGSCGQPAPARQRHRSNGLPDHLKARNRVREILNPRRTGRRSKEGCQAHWIDPTLTRGAEAATRHALSRKPGKSLAQRFRVEQVNIGAVRALRLDIRPENVDPVSRGEDQIALLSKADIGIGPESIFQTPEKVDHDLRHQNVLRRRELLTHTTGRTGSAAGGKRRVLLNDNDSAAIEG